MMLRELPFWMNLKMYQILLILLLYGVDTESINCPESCACQEILLSRRGFQSNQNIFDGRNFTKSGLDESFNDYKLALMNSVEMNQIKLSSENIFFGEEKSNKTSSAAAVVTTPFSSTPSGNPSTGKKCSKTPKENVKDIFINNFSMKTSNNSKEMRTKRTLKLNVNPIGNEATAQNAQNYPRTLPSSHFSTTEADDEGMTAGDPEEETRWGASEPRPTTGKLSTYQVVCEGVRNFKSLRVQHSGNATTRLSIRRTFFESFELFRQVLRESPMKFDRLSILSMTDNVINQESNDGNSERTRLEPSDFEAENHGAGKSRSENSEEFLPFASLQNPKLRTPVKSSETLEFQFRGKFKNVRILNLVNNTIIFLPQDAFRLFQNVEILNLSNNLLESIGNETFAPLVNLLQLDLSKNKLSALSEIIFRNLTKLLYLDLSDNSIGSVAPSTFQYLTSLVLLNLASNQLSEKEESVAFLLGTGKRLQVVDVSKTGLKQIPGTLERSVRALNLMGNHLPSIRCGDLDSYSLLSYLNLRNNKISYVEDDALGRLELLANLQIGENNLFQVPKSLPNNLEILNLSYNNIQNITNFDFLNLSLLKELSVSYNQIGSIEANALDSLIQLRVLDLSHNPILILPNVYGLAKLTRLNLSYFTNIPGSNAIRYKQFPIQSPEKIRELNLESSPLLTAVFLQDTKTLESFTELEDLDVRFSNLTTMRKDIFSLLPKLRILKVEGNPWHCGREILKLSEWLKSHDRENVVEEENEINTAHCSTPVYLYKTSLIALEEKHFDFRESGESGEAESGHRVKGDGESAEKNRVSDDVNPMRNFTVKNSSVIIESPKTVKMAPMKMRNVTKLAAEKEVGGRTPEVNRVNPKKYSKSDAKVKTLLNQRTSENSRSKSPLEKSADGKPEVRRGAFGKDSTVTRLPTDKRNSTNHDSTETSSLGTNSTEEDEKNRIVIGWNDNSTDFGILVKNSLNAEKTTPTDFRHRLGVKGKAEAVTAKDSQSLEKNYNSHLSFFVLSSIGLIAMATLTFTSVYFSRTRRDHQSYQRQSHDIEVCSISSIGNELW